MAIRKFKVCDWCKKEEEMKHSLGGSGWRNVKVEFGQYNTKTFDLCPDCLEELGLLKEDKKEISIKEPENSDKLFEIIAEMVSNAVESR